MLERSQDFQILKSGQVGQESRCLNDDTNILWEIGLPPYLFVVHKDGAAVGSQKAADTLHQDCLAGTVIADDAVDLTFFKGVGYILENVFFTKELIDIAYFDHILHMSSLRSCKAEIITLCRPDGREIEDHGQPCKNAIRLPQPGQLVVAKVMHMVGRLI